MNKITFSCENKELSEIIEFYSINKQAILDYKGRVSKGKDFREELIGLTPEEVDQYYRNLIIELEKLIILDILSAVEAKFRVDYLTRVYNRNKDHLSRIYRAIYKDKSNRASLNEDILENWKLQYPEYKNYINQYKKFLLL